MYLKVHQHKKQRRSIFETRFVLLSNSARLKCFYLNKSWWCPASMRNKHSVGSQRLIRCWERISYGRQWFWEIFSFLLYLKSVELNVCRLPKSFSVISTALSETPAIVPSVVKYVATFAVFYDVVSVKNAVDFKMAVENIIERNNLAKHTNQMQLAKLNSPIYIFKNWLAMINS